MCCDCYPDRAGLPWSSEELELVEEYFDKGLSIEDLAWVHKRTEGAITSRLQKIGRVEYDLSDRTYYRIDRTPIYTI